MRGVPYGAKSLNTANTSIVASNLLKLVLEVGAVAYQCGRAVGRVAGGVDGCGGKECWLGSLLICQVIASACVVIQSTIKAIRDYCRPNRRKSADRVRRKQAAAK